jgi:maleate isomerase
VVRTASASRETPDRSSVPWRVGLIVPSSNTVAEPDFYRHLPAEATLHTARVYLDDVTPDAEAVMLDEHLTGALRDLATARPDVVVFACTSAGTLRGKAAEEALIGRISAETDAPAVSVAGAVRRSILRRGARRVGVATPHTHPTNEVIRAGLEEDGISVCGLGGMGIVSNAAIGAVEPDAIAAFAYNAFAGADIDLLFVSCANFRAFEARSWIAAELGVPVLTSNQVALEAALDALP